MTIPITKIIIHKLKMKLNDPFTTSFGTVHQKEFLIIEAIDNEGNHGYGESVAFTVPWYTEETTKTCEHILTEFLIPILQKQKINHPDDTTELFKPVKRNNMAKAALEGAIWDLYAKRRNISLREAIGGEKTEIDIGISIGLQPTTEGLLKKIDQAVRAGFKRVKLKIKPGHDINLLQTVRSHFPDLRIMADANSAYTLHDIHHLKELDAFHLMMIEQPLGHDDIIDHAVLQQSLRTPVCLDESITSFQDARKAVELGSCKIINIKIGRVGGITIAKQIHDYCQANHIAVWCGGMLEAGVGRAHCLALSALPGFNLPGDTAGSSHYWQQDIIHPEVIGKNGIITVPNRPGIGYDIDWKVLKQYRTDTRTFSF